MHGATIDWTTISSLATAAGTLVLAIATFAAVRSSNRSARISEVALQEQRRPFLTSSRITDPDQKLGFADRHWVHLPGGQGLAEHIDGRIYLSMSLRNVGNGLAVCQAWSARPAGERPMVRISYTPIEQMHQQSRDLYVPPGDIGMWQGAIRDHGDPAYDELAAAIDAGEAISIELLYSDMAGRERTVTRFSLMNQDEQWFTSMARHWYLDWDGPRPDDSRDAAALAHLADDEVVLESPGSDAVDPESSGSADLESQH